MAHVLIFNPDDSRILDALRELQSRRNPTVRDLREKLGETTRSPLVPNLVEIIDIDLTKCSRKVIDGLLSNAIAYPIDQGQVIDFSRAMLHPNSHLMLERNGIGNSDKPMQNEPTYTQYTLNLTGYTSLK